MEARVVPPSDPMSDSAGFFRHRANVPHLDRRSHRPRLEYTARLVDAVAGVHALASISDLGCGDGGLLSLLTAPVPKWGYDVREESVANARPGTTVHHADLLTDPIEYGELVILSEVLEHLDDPHGLLTCLAAIPTVRMIVASVPVNETPDRYDIAHVWVWDRDGFRALFESCGWKVLDQFPVANTQLVVACRP